MFFSSVLRLLLLLCSLLQRSHGYIAGVWCHRWVLFQQYALLVCPYFITIRIYKLDFNSQAQLPYFLVESSFKYSDIRNWIRNIEQHASDNVNKILVGNKADMDESKRVSLGQTIKFLSHLFSTNEVTFTFSLGCPNFTGPSTSRRIRHQVFRNGKLEWYAPYVHSLLSKGLMRS